MQTDQFFRYFYDDMGRVFDAFYDIIIAIFEFFSYLFNFSERREIIESYESGFTNIDWVLLILANIVLLVLVISLVTLFAKLLRKIFRFQVPVKKYDEVQRQLQSLQRDLIRANQEKDKLLAMRVAELGLQNGVGAGLPGGEDSEDDQNGDAAFEGMMKRNTKDSPCVISSDSRFFRLTEVDNYYKTEYVIPDYETDMDLEQFCDNFRQYTAGALGLYYDIDTVRHFVASMGTARIIILQGISGTGKTSLPYAFGKFVQKDTTVVSVQPAWRERSELYGYFNEFTKKYTETDFLRAVYEANYFRDPHIIILDEMNIARVEYYFAEMLSILELPLESEWNIDIVTAMWENDPCLIDNGKVQIPNNVWFVGTINNDDSTFAVADKVYDRAIPIDLDSRAEVFEADEAEPVHISTDHLIHLFQEAKETYEISPDNLDKIEVVNKYLIKNFKLAFGNRIIKQLGDYVPCLMACGGTELQAIDFIMAKKVLRKFESLNLGFMRDELEEFRVFLNKTYGEGAMKHCIEYIEVLKRT